jgi:hypothetical protein
LVKFEPPRVIVIFVISLTAVIGLPLVDARHLSKSKSKNFWLIAMYLLTSSVCGVICILYMFDALKVDYPQIPLVGPVSIPVSSLTISALQAMATWAVKCAVTLYQSNDVKNLMLVLKANISFHSLDLDEEHQQSPNKNESSTTTLTTSVNPTSFPSAGSGNNLTPSLRLGIIEDGKPLPQTLEDALQIITNLKIQLHMARLREEQLLITLGGR